MNRKIAAVITAVTGDRVIVGEEELLHHAMKHFSIPAEVLLEVIERILRDPTVVYEERAKHVFHLFYRLEDGRYLVVVVKRGHKGTYFSSIYPTGKKIRNKHGFLKKVKV